MRSNSGAGGRIGTGPRALERGFIGPGVDICKEDVVAAGEGGGVETGDATEGSGGLAEGGYGCKKMRRIRW